MDTPAAPTPNAMPGAQAAAQQQAGQPPAGTPGTPPAAPQAQPQQQPPMPPAAPQTPPAGGAPWEASGEPFDPGRAWNTIQAQRAENQALNARLQSAQPILDEHERLRLASQSELDTAREQLTNASAERDTWRTQAVQGTAQAMAAARFTYPDAAVQLLGDLSGFATADGIDQAKITAALDALAAKYPNMLSQPNPFGLQPDRAQGQGAGGGAPSTIDAQIKAAEARGDHAASISLKQQKYAQQTAART